MSLSQYLLGVAELGVIAGALCLGAFRLRSVLLPGWSSAPARLAEAVLAITGLVLVGELLGVVGLFRDGWLVAGSVLAGLGASALARRIAPGEAGAPPAPAVGPWMLALSLAAGFLVVAHWAIPTQQALDVGMYAQDTIWYHLSFSARFVQEARVGPLHFTDPLATTSWFYPQNSELLHAVGMAAFDHDVASPLINTGAAALALLAAWCIGRPYGVAPLTLLAGAIVLDTPMMLEQAGNAPNDTIALFFLFAVVALLANGEASARRRALPGSRLPAPALPPTGALILAGLAAGLALGTKITLLAAIGALTLGLIWLARGARLRTAAIWLACLAIPSLFWYARNLLTARNPLPWVDSAGPIPLPGPEQLELYPRKPHTVANYANDPGVWSDWFFPALDDRLGPLWAVLLVAAAAGLVVLAIRGRSPILRLLAVVGAVAALAYVFTPLSASGGPGSPSGFAPNLRYLSPGLGIGLVLLPLALGALPGRRRWIAAAALAAALAVGTVVQMTFESESRPLTQAELEVLARGEQHGYRSFAQDSYELDKEPGALLLGGALVLVPAALMLVGDRRRIVAVAGSAAVVIAVLALGWPAGRDFVHDRYDTSLANPFEREAGFRASPQWKRIQEWARGVADSRIAVAGRAAAFGQYVFYGQDLDNRVQYLGEETNDGGLRPLRSCADWKRRLNDGGYDYVVVTPRFGEEAFSTPPERRWTDRDPAARSLLDAEPAAVYEIAGELDPDRCPAVTAPRGPGAAS